MNYPDIAVLVVTYNRPDEIRETLRALQFYMRYSGVVHWYLADDGSPEGYTDTIRKTFPRLGFRLSLTKRAGWGGNVNQGLKDIAQHFIFLIEDDYVAQKPIDLNQGVALLAANTQLGAIRYDGIAGHDLMLHLEEHTTGMGKIPYLRILKESRSLNIYSNRPHLKHLRLHDRYGYYAMGKALGPTEENFAHRVKDRYDNNPHIACLADGVELAFKHIGKSYQNTKEDVGGK